MTKTAPLTLPVVVLSSDASQPLRAARKRYPEINPRRRTSSVTQSHDVSMSPIPQRDVMGSVADD